MSICPDLTPPGRNSPWIGNCTLDLGHSSQDPNGSWPRGGCGLSSGCTETLPRRTPGDRDGDCQTQRDPPSGGGSCGANRGATRRVEVPRRWKPAVGQLPRRRKPPWGHADPRRVNRRVAGFARPWWGEREGGEESPETPTDAFLRSGNTVSLLCEISFPGRRGSSCRPRCAFSHPFAGMRQARSPTHRSGEGPEESIV